jgi:hypothetical protein
MVAECPGAETFVHLAGQSISIPLARAQRHSRATAAQPRVPQASSATSCAAAACAEVTISAGATGLGSTLRSADGG